MNPLRRAVSRPRRVRRSPLGPRAVLLLFALMAMATVPAWGRAGGGEHHRSGGSSRSSGGGSRSSSGSSRSSSGSSGSFSSGGSYSSSYSGSYSSGSDVLPFELVWVVFRLTARHPGVMVPLWLVLGLVVWSRSRGETRRDIRRWEQERLKGPPPDEALAPLRARDPDFSLSSLLVRCERDFSAVQEAWFRRRLETVRHVMSDGLYRRFTVLQGLMQLEGRRDALADVQVHSTALLSASCAGAFDIITVRIDASVRDAEVPADLDDDEARGRARKADSERFTELWTFARRQGATTRAGHDSSQGQCPQCGAPFTGGSTGQCEYCNAIVNSGRHDWVLTEITQSSEYLPPGRIPVGLAPLQESDPEAAAEILEDRALLTFWKWLEAYARGDSKVLSKVARPELQQEVAEVLARFQSNGTPTVVRMPAVGGADLLEVEVNANGVDRIHIDLRWSATASLDPDDVLGRMTPRPRRHVLQLVRKTGATGSAAGLSTERCGTCQAPLTASESTQCDYCGADLASGAHDWVLESVVPFERWQRPSTHDNSHDPAREAARRSFATRSERTRLLQSLAALARADGEVSREERTLLRRCAGRWGVPWHEVEVLLHGHATLQPEGLGALPPEQGEEILSHMVAMVLADGKLHARERALLEEGAAAMHLPEGTVERLLAARRPHAG